MTQLSVGLDSWPVAEIFGPTIQGEGRFAGQVVSFIRFGGCDYRCVWCDSMHAVDEKEVAKLEVLDVPTIIDRLLNCDPNVKHVVLSGGNPFLYDLTPLVTRLRAMGIHISVETQGSKFKSWAYLVDLVTLSPKPPSSRMMFSLSRVSGFEEFLSSCRMYHIEYDVKIVVFDDKDLDFARMIATKYHLDEIFLSVGTGPGEGVEDVSNRFRWLCEAALQPTRSLFHLKKLHILPQLHFYAWGHEKGH